MGPWLPRGELDDSDDEPENVFTGSISSENEPSFNDNFTYRNIRDGTDRGIYSRRYDGHGFQKGIKSHRRGNAVYIKDHQSGYSNNNPEISDYSTKQILRNLLPNDNTDTNIVNGLRAVFPIEHGHVQPKRANGTQTPTGDRENMKDRTIDKKRKLARNDTRLNTHNDVQLTMLKQKNNLDEKSFNTPEVQNYTRVENNQQLCINQLGSVESNEQQTVNKTSGKVSYIKRKKEQCDEVNLRRQQTCYHSKSRENQKANKDEIIDRENTYPHKRETIECEKTYQTKLGTMDRDTNYLPALDPLSKNKTTEMPLDDGQSVDKWKKDKENYSQVHLNVGLVSRGEIRTESEQSERHLEQHSWYGGDEHSTGSNCSWTDGDERSLEDTPVEHNQSHKCEIVKEKDNQPKAIQHLQIENQVKPDKKPKGIQHRPVEDLGNTNNNPNGIQHRLVEDPDNININPEGIQHRPLEEPDNPDNDLKEIQHHPVEDSDNYNNPKERQQRPVEDTDNPDNNPKERQQRPVEHLGKPDNPEEMQHRPVEDPDNLYNYPKEIQHRSVEDPDDPDNNLKEMQHRQVEDPDMPDNNPKEIQHSSVEDADNPDNDLMEIQHRPVEDSDNPDNSPKERQNRLIDDTDNPDNNLREIQQRPVEHPGKPDHPKEMQQRQVEDPDNPDNNPKETHHRPVEDPDKPGNNPKEMQQRPVEDPDNLENNPKETQHRPLEDSDNPDNNPKEIQHRPVEDPDNLDNDLKEIQHCPVEYPDNTNNSPKEIQHRPLEDPDKPDNDLKEMQQRQVEDPDNPDNNPNETHHRPVEDPDKPGNNPKEMQQRPVEDPDNPENNPKETQHRPVEDSDNPDNNPKEIQHRPVEDPDNIDNDLKEIQHCPVEYPDNTNNSPKEIQHRPLEDPDKPDNDLKEIQHCPMEDSDIPDNNPKEIQQRPVEDPDMSNKHQKEIQQRPVEHPGKPDHLKEIQHRPVEDRNMPDNNLKEIQHRPEEDSDKPGSNPKEMQQRPIEDPDMPDNNRKELQHRPVEDSDNLDNNPKEMQQQPVEDPDKPDNNRKEIQQRPVEDQDKHVTLLGESECILQIDAVTIEDINNSQLLTECKQDTRSQNIGSAGDKDIVKISNQKKGSRKTQMTSDAKPDLTHGRDDFDNDLACEDVKVTTAVIQNKNNDRRVPDDDEDASCSQTLHDYEQEMIDEYLHGERGKSAKLSAEMMRKCPKERRDRDKTPTILIAKGSRRDQLQHNEALTIDKLLAVSSKKDHLPGGKRRSNCGIIARGQFGRQCSEGGSDGNGRVPSNRENGRQSINTHNRADSNNNRENEDNGNNDERNNNNNNRRDDDWNRIPERNNAPTVDLLTANVPPNNFKYHRERREMGPEFHFRQTSHGHSTDPKYPHFQHLANRMKSFEGWPKESYVKASDLANSGLFYRGDRDTVICFHCGGILSQWEKGDNPKVEHKRWFPRCQNTDLDHLQAKRSPVRAPSVKYSKRLFKALFDRSYGCQDVVKAMDTHYDRSPERLPTLDDLTDILQENTNDEAGNISIPALVYSSCEVKFGQCLHLQENKELASSYSDQSACSVCELLVENCNMRAELKCKHCRVRDRNIIFLPCGHLQLCEECARNFDRCVYGCIIREKKKIYM